ncbi:MAG: cytochrome c biogenesis protein CcsA [Pontiellaceae bacterium]|jgi:ABC-type transport system involved in cytochrome c biogenesis permease subunit|nr:cytochrome c biogenesis protein CcsA [Pontiellaceae bacterium]
MTRWLIPLLSVAAAGYLLSGAVFLFRHKRTAAGLMGAAWLVNLAVFVLNGLIVGHPPFGNMYQVQVVLSLCFLPLFILLSVRDRLFPFLTYFAIASALPLIGALFMDKQAAWRRMPALQSGWFVPHVLAYLISYALCTVAFILLLNLRLNKNRRDELRCAIVQILRTAFPFMTFGLLSGALWAEEAWGQYWSWDAKEVWSLITWGLYLLYFHLRRSDWRRCADWAHLLAFLALLTTFFLVNLLPKLGSLLHSYA